MGRVLTLLYGGGCYLMFFAVFLYLIGFLTNAYVPKGIDDGPAVGVAPALLIDVGLLLLFGLQHSVMARPAFKRWWTTVVPESIERSTYVLATNIVLLLLFWLWQPLTQTIWQVESPFLRNLLWGVFAFGLLVVFLSTFIIDHFDLTGLRQVYTHFRQRPYRNPGFRVALFYRLVRHPLYTGFFLAFWATPDMTLGHFLFALGMSIYILIAVRYEERDLAAALGDDYVEYQKSVPMLIPAPGKIHEPIKPTGSVPSGMR